MDVIAETLSVIRYFAILKFNFNNVSLTWLIVLSKFFRSLNPNKVYNVCSSIINRGVLYEAEYQNLLFFYWSSKVIKSMKKITFSGI